MSQTEEECVLKRNGNTETVSFDKILKRIKTLGDEAGGLSINYTTLCRKIIDQLYNKIPTSEIDELTAQQCASLLTTNDDYGILASRVLISNHQKNTDEDFQFIITRLYNYTDIHGERHPLISEELCNIVNNPYNTGKIQSWFDFDRDYLLDYFGFKTLERAYLMKINGLIVERPQHMWMRVALGIHGEDLEAAQMTYNLMSQKYFTHATPTLFNAGTPRPQMSSCYLLAMEKDSINGIYNTLHDCASISKWAGGIGMHIHNVRAEGSHIRGTNGTSNGIVPMLQVFNYTARYVDQGGGKRAGSFAIYLEPWHGDIEAFLDMKKNHGDEEMRARDLFYALWIPDLFMERVRDDKEWTLMCPDKCRGLSDAVGDEFKLLYEQYEKENKGIKTVKARKIWLKILDSQMETGVPYMLYKDAANSKSNQKNLGTIRSSNLCCVQGDTLLLTDKGHQIIETLKDKKVNVWNGEEFSEVVVKQTNDKAELLTIAFSDGSELTCTKYHKFYIQTKFPSKMKQDVIKSKSVQLVEAQDLKLDMKLIKCEYPIINNKIELKSAYTNGIFSADGTFQIHKKEERKCNFKSLKGKSFCKRHINYQRKDEFSEYCCGISYTKKARISLYGEKIKLLEYLDYRSVGEEKNNRLNVTLPVDLKDKFFVPTNYSLKSKLDWFAGYCDGDGHIARNGTNQSLQIACIHKEFLLKIKLMLQTCGIASKVTLNMNERLSYLPNGKGGMAHYKTKKLWRLLIGSNDLQKLVEFGFAPKRLIINKHEPQRNATQFVKISKITDNGEMDKTFWFTEKKRHAGIFNGVITSQCEIIEYSDSKETACCNLASIALGRFVSYGNFDNEPKIEIYTINNCKWCKRAKKWCQIRNINYVEHFIEDNLMEDFKKAKGIDTLPLICVNDIKLGEFNDLKNSSAFAPTFDYKLLHDITKVVTENLNKVIDRNFYPTEKTRVSNMKHRPIGIGVQGLADTFALMDISFHSADAKIVNSQIFETIYHAALEKSMELAEQHGHYDTFKGSPASKGILQFDMWGVFPTRYPWSVLKEKIKLYGLRNSLLIAPMPTASTSQILGFNECFEPFTSNIYLRRTLAGEFIMVNKYLMNQLSEIDLWTDEIKNKIIKNNGSVQNIEAIPAHLKEKYKIVWEIPMKHLIDMSADRGAFICQSQSLNLWMKDPDYQRLTSMHFYSWKKGLKTGI